MLRQISEDVRVNLKDRLRDFRNVIRQSRHDSENDANALREATSHLPPFPGKGIEGLLGHAASVVDDALSIAESFVPHERPAGADGTTAKSLGTYFALGDQGQPPGGERVFRRDMYYLTKAVLADLNIDAAGIHEADFAAVHAAMRRRHADLLAAADDEAAPTERLSSIAALCSALLIEFLNHRPIRFAEAAPDMSAGIRGMDRSLEIRCLAPVALACGLATIGADDSPEPDILETAILAADVRHDRILQACGKADAIGELTAVFAVLLAHLP